MTLKTHHNITNAQRANHVYIYAILYAFINFNLLKQNLSPFPAFAYAYTQESLQLSGVVPSGSTNTYFFPPTVFTWQHLSEFAWPMIE